MEWLDFNWCKMSKGMQRCPSISSNWTFEISTSLRGTSGFGSFQEALFETSWDSMDPQTPNMSTTCPFLPGPRLIRREDAGSIHVTKTLSSEGRLTSKTQPIKNGSSMPAKCDLSKFLIMTILPRPTRSLGSTWGCQAPSMRIRPCNGKWTHEKT